MLTTTFHVSPKQQALQDYNTLFVLVSTSVTLCFNHVMQFPDKNDRRVNVDSVSSPPPPVQESVWRNIFTGDCWRVYGTKWNSIHKGVLWLLWLHKQDTENSNWNHTKWVPHPLCNKDGITNVPTVANVNTSTWLFIPFCTVHATGTKM